MSQDPMEETERQGQVNRLEISGYLQTDVTETCTTTGKDILKARIIAYQGSGKEKMFFDITVWASDLTHEQKNEMLAFKRGASVIVTGKLTTRTWKERLYLGIDATSLA